jgi:hypothetical protein
MHASGKPFWHIYDSGCSSQILGWANFVYSLHIFFKFSLKSVHVLQMYINCKHNLTNYTLYKKRKWKKGDKSLSFGNHQNLGGPLHEASCAG